MSNDIQLPPVGTVVTLAHEDWGDDDRRIRMVNVYAGVRALGPFDTLADAMAFCTEHGYTLASHADSIKANAIAANRAAFEWGFRMAEKGIHNLESALIEFDKVMES